MIYSIGYAGRTIEDFTSILKKYEIDVLVDVRSSPWSRYTPDYTSESLKKILKSNDITYLWLGDMLGGRPKEQDVYKDGNVVFSLVMKLPSFEKGIERLLEGTRKYRIALMCAEKDPLNCHRFALVSRALVEKKAQVYHILYDGAEETHEQAMERLLKMEGLEEADLFMDTKDRFQQAYDRQEKRISYTVAEPEEEYKAP